MRPNLHDCCLRLSLRALSSLRHQERHGTSSCLRKKDIDPASSGGLLRPTGAGRGVQVSPHTRQPWRLDAREIVTDVSPLRPLSVLSSALSAQNFLQSCLGRAPGPRFLVGDVHSVCDNGPGRTLRGRLPWLISSSDNREVSPLYLLESWPGLGGGLEGEAQPHCRPSWPGHLGRKGSASECREPPSAFHAVCRQKEGFNSPLTDPWIARYLLSSPLGPSPVQSALGFQL